MRKGYIELVPLFALLALGVLFLTQVSSLNWASDHITTFVLLGVGVAGFILYKVM